MIGNKQNSNLCSFAENPTGRIISGHTVGSSENFESHWHWDVHLGECGMSQGATLIISFIFLKRLAPGIVWKPFGCWQVTMAFHREGWGFLSLVWNPPHREGQALTASRNHWMPSSSPSKNLLLGTTQKLWKYFTLPGLREGETGEGRNGYQLACGF